MHRPLRQENGPQRSELTWIRTGIGSGAAADCHAVDDDGLANLDRLANDDRAARPGAAGADDSVGADRGAGGG